MSLDVSKFENTVSNITNPVKTITGAIKGGISSLFKNAFPGLSGLIGVGFSVDSQTQHITATLQKTGGVGMNGITPEFQDPAGGINRVIVTDKKRAKNIDDVMEKNKINSPQYATYPTDLTYSSYFIEIQFGEYKRPQYSSNIDFQPMYTVNLPLPAQLADAQGLGWSVQNTGMTGFAMNVAGDAIAGFMKGYKKGQGQESVAEGLTSLGKDVFTSKAMDIGYGALYAASQIYKNSSTLGVVSQAIQGVVGTAPNPFPGAFYVGPEMRQFGFNWQFVPDHEDESIIIKNIIREIRARTLSTPTDDNALFLKYPSVCKIRLHPISFFGEMFPIKLCVLNGINIDYTPYGLSFHNDNRPTAISLGLNFAEIEPLFSEDYGGDKPTKDKSEKNTSAKNDTAIEPPVSVTQNSSQQPPLTQQAQARIDGVMSQNYRAADFANQTQQARIGAIETQKIQRGNLETIERAQLTTGKTYRPPWYNRAGRNPFRRGP